MTKSSQFLVISLQASSTCWTVSLSRLSKCCLMDANLLRLHSTSLSLSAKQLQVESFAARKAKKMHFDVLDLHAPLHIHDLREPLIIHKVVDGIDCLVGTFYDFRCTVRRHALLQGTSSALQWLHRCEMCKVSDSSAANLGFLIPP